MLNISSKFNIDGSFVGGDKSISHRALMLAAVADGECVISNLSLCADVASTVRCLRALGADITLCGNVARVKPIAVPNDNVVLDCGNSGTTARLLAGLACGLGVHATFVGDKSLAARPMGRVTEPLQQLGAKFSRPDGALFATCGCALVGQTIKAKVNSAQVKSAVLLAGMFADGTTNYVEDIATRDHTERLMRFVGVSCDGTSVTKSRPRAFSVSVPNDFSSAAYLVAAAVLTKRDLTLRDVGVNPLRIGFLRVLTRSGANIQLVNQREICGEPVADIVVKSSALQPLAASKIDVCDSIDEVPLLATLALAIKGTSTFCNVGELAKKESDRIVEIINIATICGQKAVYDGRDLTIVSDGKLPVCPVFGNTDDHRMVMCQAVLCLLCGGGTVQNYGCVKVSFPQFWQSLGIEYKRFAVVGSDISYSKSPQLMGQIAAKRDVGIAYDIVGLPSDVSDEGLKAVFDGYDGCNVTIPFKRRAAQIYRSALSSVNTVCRFGATSTDGVGLLRALDNHGFAYTNAPLWVVGAGGAAEACVAELVKHGAKIKLLNRTQQHADELTKKYGLSDNVDNPVGVLSFVPPCDFEQTVPLPDSVQYVFVASYGHDKQSDLLTRAKQAGLPCADGVDMLYFQAEASFDFWTNVSKKGVRI